MATVSVSAVQAQFPTGVVSAPAATIPLVDNSGGATNGQSGYGRYTIQVTTAGKYRVVKGTPPFTSDAQTIATVRYSAAGVFTADKRTRGISYDGVNATVNSTPNASGSYLAAGAVTPETLSSAVSSLLGATATGTAFPASPTAGQFFYRSDQGVLYVWTGTIWQAGATGVTAINTKTGAVTIAAADGSITVDNGTAGEIKLSVPAGSSGVTAVGASAPLSSSGGATPTISYTGPILIGIGTADPATRTGGGALVAGDGFFRTDLGALRVYVGGAWTTAGVPGVSTINAKSGAVTIVAADSSVTVDNSVAGTIKLSASGSGGSVTSIQGETGAIALDSPDGSVTITNTGATIHLAAAGGGGGSSYPHPIDAPPSSPSAWDDEFTSSTLNSAWTQFAGGSKTDRTVTMDPHGSGYVTIDAPTPGDSNEYYGILKGFAAGIPFTVTAKIAQDFFVQGFNGVHLLVGDANYLLTAGIIGRYSPTLSIERIHTSGSFGGDVWTNGYLGTQELYVRIKYDGTNLSVFFAQTGHFSATPAWSGSASSLGIGTPDRFGLGVITQSYPCTLTSDWFRVTTP